MGKVILDMSMSLDGFIAGPKDNLDHLQRWIFGGHPHPASAKFLDEFLNETGAVIMGRRMYDLANKQGAFDDDSFTPPHFVITHNVPESSPHGGADFTFVTDGIESALQQAQKSAGDKNVVIMGGANIAQQFLNASLLDQFDLSLVPILLRDGIKLFENITVNNQEFGTPVVIESTGVTHLRYPVKKPLII